MSLIKNISTVVVCGAGTMGSGIAQAAAQAGLVTILFDVNELVLQKAKTSIAKSLEQLVAKGKMSSAIAEECLSRLSFCTNINECKADLIIEAIIEKKEAKQSLFLSLANINNENTIYCSNTSSISINDLAKGFAFAENFAGLHFFNPATIMKLVEVIKAEKTNDDVIESLVAFCKRLNKTPVVCKDAPGFIVNRVARHYYLEAMKLIELNMATIENVDAIMEATGFKMGPFKLMDLIGMDINYGVSNIVWAALGKPERLKPSVIQKEKVDAGNLGKKSGKGFYSY